MKVRAYKIEGARWNLHTLKFHTVRVYRSTSLEALKAGQRMMELGYSVLIRGPKGLVVA